MIDKGLLELVGPSAFALNFLKYSQRLSRITSGYIYHYSFLIIMGLGCLFVINVFVAESLSSDFLVLQFLFVVIFLINFSTRP